jgi:NAD(P)-dependent dehydrogenase (short-subunit alcohol dehydrogenase family)
MPDTRNVPAAAGFSPRRRTAIVTGAASGLGRAISVRLARDGWQIVLADVDLAGCGQTAVLVEQAGGLARVEQLDVTSAAEWARLVERLRSDGIELDLLVNNAGVAGCGAIGDFSLSDWRWTIDVNLFGAIHGCHTCRDWLVSNPHGGYVVNIASVAAIVAAPTMGAYNVSKAGVLALSETLYAELRPLGVGVTVVCPGFFATNLVATGRFQTADQRAMAVRLMQNARISADDVAEALVRAMRRRRLYVVLPARARIYWRLRRLWPAAMMKFVAWVSGERKKHQQDSASV